MLEKLQLNPEPTDVQLATFARHKAAGTSPGNPKWYKPQVVRPFVFKQGMPPVYPRLGTGAEWNTKHNKHSARRPEDVPTRYVPS